MRSGGCRWSMDDSNLMTILRRLSPSWTGSEPYSQEVVAGCTKTDRATGQGRVSPYTTFDMPTWLSPAMSDQNLLNAVIAHYVPRIQNYLSSANLKSTEKALAFFTKLQSLENSRELYRSARQYFDRQDHNRRKPRDQPNDSTGNRRPNGSVQLCHVRRDVRDRTPTGDSIRNPRTNEGQRSFAAVSGDVRMALSSS